ncbi:MAG: hypothetical protein DSZ03_05960 [Sulfurimonas sp.]|nr:MAG: hypothetical protein DSZ03_05960 [Sulfurimonas sp.]
MLIYNHNKEFIGIDVNDLQKLHYRSFSDLLNTCSDFADLFVKKPGFIHNFKNFNWIDFVMHSDSDASNVLISANQKTFSATLNISTIYLTDAPGEPGFLVELCHLKSLQDDDAPASEPAFENTRPILAELPEFDEMEPTTLVEPDPLDVPEYSDFDTLDDEQHAAIYNPESSFLADNREMSHTPPAAPEIPTFETSPSDIGASNVPPPLTPSSPVSGSTDNLSLEEEALLQQHLHVDLNYCYTPQTAADELGLPVDLIEEFIGDFIAQAYEFKDELFTSIDNHNFDNIKNLSHKLKGVAANLRIDDSFEVLTLLNTTHDIDEAATYLKYFYNTIAKLGGKEIDAYRDDIPSAATAPSPTEETEETPSHTDTPDDDTLYAFETKASAQVPAEDPHTVPSAHEDPEHDNSLYHFDTLIKRDATLPSLEVALGGGDGQELQNTQNDTADNTPKEPYGHIHYNQSKAAYELGISPDFITELKEDFIAQTQSLESAFQTALSQDDAQRYKSLALELKGVSDNLHIDDISSTLEALINSDATPDAQHAVNRLFHYIKQL